MARKSSDSPSSAARRDEEKNPDETVIMTIRVDKRTSSLLDALAELYGVTKTDIAREGILERARELSSPGAVDAKAKEYASTLNYRYQKFAEAFGSNPGVSSPRRAEGSTLTKPKPTTAP